MAKLKTLFLSILLLVLLAGCNSSGDIIGIWKPAEGRTCLEDIAELEFTNEDRVKVLIGDGREIELPYTVVAENSYRIDGSQYGVIIEGTLSSSDGKLTLDLHDNEGDSCQFIKNE